MPIVQNPQYDPTSAYQPVSYETFATAAAPDEVKYVEFDIKADGVVIATDRKTFYKTEPSLGIPGATEFYFLIDVQQYLQRYLAPNRGRSSMFGDLGAATTVDNSDAYVEVEIDFRYWLLNGTTGKIEVYPLSETSDIRYVNITKRQNGDLRDLATEFVGIPGVDPDKRLLTNSPYEQDICENGNAFNTFISPWNYMRVQTYDANGVQITDSYAPTTGTFNQQTTVGVGPPQLLAITTWLNGLAPNFTGAAFYVITYGAGLVVGPAITFIPNSLQKTYNLVPCCDKKLNLFWLNDLGGVDNRQFSYVELNPTVTGNVFEKPLGWNAGVEPPHLQDDFGRALTDVKVTRQYSISVPVTSIDMEWLRELKWSLEVYIQNPDGSNNYWRCYVVPGTFTERVIKGLIQLEFELAISQDIVTHRI